MKNPPKYGNVLQINCSDKEHYIAYSDIVFIEAQSAQSCIYTLAGSIHEPKIVVCKTLKEVEELLPPVDFFRCHHHNIVHFKHVRQHIKKEHLLLLTNNHKVSISRSHAEKFAAAFKRYNFANY